MNDIFYEKQRSSQAFEKLINYTEGLKNDPTFASELRWFRSKNIKTETLEVLPLEGLPIPKTPLEHKNNLNDYTLRLSKTGDEYPDLPEYKNRKQSFQEKYALDIFGDAFDFLLFYNSVEPMKKQGQSDFAIIEDLGRLLEWHISDYYNNQEKYNPELLEEMNKIAKITPVAICIHPYMSERDVLDFVKKTYKTTIEPMQKEYRNPSIKLKDVRIKSKIKQTRNSFIYENRDLPITELVSLVTKEYGKVFDYAYIQTIIRKEKDKRN